MKHTRSNLLILGLLPAALTALCSSPSNARVWRVERDGSGDFTTIKPAIAAASPGDTIELGPGRYDEAEQFSPAGAWSALTYVGVDKDNLTIRGVDRDAVIIGPTAQDFEGFGPLGVVTDISVASLTVENLTVENVYDGLYLLGEVNVRDVQVRRCHAGAFGVDGARVQATQCEFRNCVDGVAAYACQTVEVADCLFVQVGVAGNLRFCQLGEIRRCRMELGAAAAQFDATDGLVEGCTMLNQLVAGVIALDGATVTISDNIIEGSQTPLRSQAARLIGSRNLLRGTEYSIWLLSGSTADLHFNDIVPAQGLAVRADWYNPGTYAVDMSDNYWGVETAQEIAVLIHDGNDDPTIPFTVDFEPFSIRSVPTAPVSIGELKSRYAPAR